MKRRSETLTWSAQERTLIWLVSQWPLLRSGPELLQLILRFQIVFSRRNVFLLTTGICCAFRIEQGGQTLAPGPSLTDHLFLCSLSWEWFSYFQMAGKIFFKVPDTLKYYENQTSVSIEKLFWCTAIPICFIPFMAAFELQWQNWVVVTETIWPQNLKYHLSFCGETLLKSALE